jgi:hypothetical protein
MITTFKNQLSGIGIAAVLGLASVVPASAGPMLSNGSGISAATSDNVVDVRWRRGGRGVGVGIAAGALFGAAIAGSAYGYGYGPTYAYSNGPAYYEPYAYQSYGYASPYPYGAYEYGGYGRRQQHYETPVGPPVYGYGHPY